jgi:GNAT superfamily N-acetyltransferase
MSEPASFHVRAAIAADAETLRDLVYKLAVYERSPGEAQATADDFARHGSGDHPLFKALLGEEGGRAVGFALYFFGFSTWTGGPVLHLEDLFVIPEARRRGVGLSLIKALAREATARGCKRFVFHVLHWNEPAIRFYESLGATMMRQWLPVRFEGAALARLADR